MVKQYKVDKVEQLRERIGNSKGSYLADFQGMDVAMATELRNRCREAGVHFEVVKNTLTLRALNDDVREDLRPFLNGPTAIATSDADEVVAAKIINDFIKEFEMPTLKGGLIDGKVVDGDQAQTLAKLPSKEVLLGQLIGGLKSPIQKLHGALSSPLRNLASVLKQAADKQAQ
ncbi:MAG: 50S ribosomal protein L10 [Candidatus Eisenbacteria bacterium]|uniref:Large ribosomal subunit protein uL10 n=1 Tax=Eiseniibacteriota bacterium TaxID=2212470 RepID=A0A7Y2H1R4_UNCEI|nr:50S ribosomal protein L10 [Candidatus Eisenbacteria bacterium]